MTKDRKTLIREYKEAPRPIGVGVIRNTNNAKSLLVVGLNIRALLNRHHAQLRMGGHPNRALQDDWNALGEEGFQLEILDTITPSDTPDYDPAEDLRTLEALWMEKLAPFEPVGYHRRPKQR
jgi:hypothetical protein